MRPARTVTAQLVAALQPAFAFATSLVLHLLLVSPLLVMWWLDARIPDDPAGEDGVEDGPVGNDGGEVPLGEPTPVNVSVYVEPVEATTPVTEAGAGPAAAKAAAPSAKGAKDGDPNAGKVDPAERLGARGNRPRGKPEPCEAIEEITTIGMDRWRVERDVVDYYATRLKELEKHVGVSTHRDANGKPDGARIYLPRCSLLRQAGLRHADIVNSINGRRIATLPDAIAAYLFLRNEDNLQVEITRKNGDKLTLRYRLRK